MRKRQMKKLCHLHLNYVGRLVYIYYILFDVCVCFNISFSEVAQQNFISFLLSINCRNVIKFDMHIWMNVIQGWFLLFCSAANDCHIWRSWLLHQLQKYFIYYTILRNRIMSFMLSWKTESWFSDSQRVEYYNNV